MEKIIIEISKEKTSLSKERGFLNVTQSGKTTSVAIDNIFSVIITSTDALLSKNVINALTEKGIIIFLCGSSFLPESVILPTTIHCLSGSRMKTQINASRDLNEKLWQTIIRQKIHNQATVLSYFDPFSKDFARLNFLEKSVLKNDSSNAEGQASKVYFKALFGKEFIRNRSAEDCNIYLNYAYIVLRSCIIRAICASGLTAVLGIKHCNPTNAYPLADDLIEPFRPIADYFVKKISERHKNEKTELTPAIKREICGLLTFPCKGDHGKLLLPEAIAKTVYSLTESYKNSEDTLYFPKLNLSS